MSPTRKDLGQYFTPPEIIRFIYDMIDFQPHWRVMDPACGDGGFLREAIQRGCTNVTGIDIDPGVVRQARCHLAGARIHCADGLQYKYDTFDLVIGNPPFRNQHRALYSETVKHSLCKEVNFPADRSIPLEVLFLAKFIALARPSGKVAIILPTGVFANSRLRFVREYLIEQCTLHAVVQLPPGAFRHTQAHTCILHLTRTPSSVHHQVFLAVVGRDLRRSLDRVLSTWRAKEIGG